MKKPTARQGQAGTTAKYGKSASKNVNRIALTAIGLSTNPHELLRRAWRAHSGRRGRRSRDAFGDRLAQTAARCPRSN